MRLSNSYFFTKRENVDGEESTSANLLVRSGMIKKAGSGIYYFLPLGFKVIQNIEKIVREEMNNIGSQELVMPSLLPEDVYVKSGRRDVFGHDMFNLKDRFNRNYVLGPTHEEMFAEVAREVIKSYKDMPISLYQIANKYRDEPRSRYGLIRVREFIMKDAYTFDKDYEGLDKSYQLMFGAYKRIFDRIGLNYRIVKASTGAMGGLLSEEFQAVTDIGEDVLVLCDKCDFSTNIEVCPCKADNYMDNEKEKEKELFNTPNCGTIEDLVKQYNFNTKKMTKTLIYKADTEYYACMVRSDREINESKLAKLLGVKAIELALPEEDEKITGAKVGFAGPVDIKIPVIVDNEILTMKNFLVGANRSDYHYINTNVKDFNYFKVGDIRNITEDDVCPQCGGKLEFKHGIEVGNTFKLGTKYSEALGLYFTDIDNSQKPVIMGSYGIGIARILAAIVEQNNDANGMILSDAIAPYKVAIVVVNAKDKNQMDVANMLYDELNKMNVETLIDDRDLRVGVKFNDMDLIGIPKRVTVGRKANDGIVEFKARNSSDVKEIDVKEVVNYLQ